MLHYYIMLYLWREKGSQLIACGIMAARFLITIPHWISSQSCVKSAKPSSPRGQTLQHDVAKKKKKKETPCKTAEMQWSRPIFPSSIFFKKSSKPLLVRSQWLPSGKYRSTVKGSTQIVLKPASSGHLVSGLHDRIHSRWKEGNTFTDQSTLKGKKKMTSFLFLLQTE